MSILGQGNILKRFSIVDIKALLYVVNLFHVDEDYRNEALFVNILQNVLLLYGMVCSIVEYIHIHKNQKFIETSSFFSSDLISVQPSDIWIIDSLRNDPSSPCSEE